MVWVIAFGELFFGDLWCVVWGYGGMRTHFSLLNPVCSESMLQWSAHSERGRPSITLGRSLCLVFRDTVPGVSD